MAQAPDLPEIDPSVGDAMFADLDTRTTDQVVADIAAANPTRHGMPVEERKRRARALTNALDFSNLVIEDQLIIAAGGDPNEMMPGNKPRWTVADEADASGSRTVKDHLTGDEFGQIQGPAASAEQHQVSDAADAIDGSQTDGAGQADRSSSADNTDVVNDGSNPSGSASYAIERANCDHKFGEPLTDESKCTRCTLTFGEWANS